MLRFGPWPNPASGPQLYSPFSNRLCFPSHFTFSAQRPESFTRLSRSRAEEHHEVPRSDRPRSRTLHLVRFDESDLTTISDLGSREPQYMPPLAVTFLHFYFRFSTGRRLTFGWQSNP